MSRIYTTTPAKVRFWMKVRVAPADACWEWLGGRNVHGYGKFTNDGTTHGAHRWAYELLVGEIPDGMHLDHECHNADQSCNAGRECPHRRCVNPAHLMPKPPFDNLMSGRSIVANNARKTHCPQGHPYDDRDSYNTPRARYCRTCHRERYYLYKAAKLARQS